MDFDEEFLGLPPEEEDVEEEGEVLYYDPYFDDDPEMFEELEFIKQLEKEPIYDPIGLDDVMPEIKPGVENVQLESGLETWDLNVSEISIEEMQREMLETKRSAYPVHNALDSYVFKYNPPELDSRLERDLKELMLKQPPKSQRHKQIQRKRMRMFPQRMPRTTPRRRRLGEDTQIKPSTLQKTPKKKKKKQKQQAEQLRVDLIKSEDIDRELRRRYAKLLDDYKKLVESNQKTKNEFENVKTTFAKCKNEYIKLIEKNKKLESKLAEFGKMSEKTSEYLQCQRDLVDLQNEINQKKTQMKNMKRSFDVFVLKERKSEVIKYQQLQRSCQNLNNVNVRLKAENDKLYREILQFKRSSNFEEKLLEEYEKQYGSRPSIQNIRDIYIEALKRYVGRTKLPQRPSSFGKLFPKKKKIKVHGIQKLKEEEVLRRMRSDAEEEMEENDEQDVSGGGFWE